MKKGLLGAAVASALLVVGGLALAAQVSPNDYACYQQLFYGRTDGVCLDQSTKDLHLFSNGTSVLELDVVNNRLGSVQAGANTACDTTCTSACVFGVNTASATADIVACSDATADECLCAGAN